MRAGFVLLATVSVVAGCGTSGSSVATRPDEEPGHAMVRLVQNELHGRLGSSYAMLVDEQRKAVDHDLYVGCTPGLPRKDVRVLVLRVRDQVFDVPTLGEVATKAVTYEMSIPDANGERVRITDTGHLIAQDGEWRWTLSRRSLSALLVGACP
jgi:hypothetical protein